MGISRPVARATALVLSALALAALTAAADASADPPPAASRCGTKSLYGHPLELRVKGKQLSCAKVHALVRGACRDLRTWTCFPPRAPDPAALVWMPTYGIFTENPSTVIEAMRYPCAQANVTATTWTAARLQDAGYPSRMQVLADDMIRCRLLHNHTEQAVLALLGHPDDDEITDGLRDIGYSVGTERDSIFTIDDEVFMIEFNHHHRVVSASFQQT